MSPKIRALETEINYLQSGSGEDVVLIHGLGANMAFWYPRILMPLAREFRVTIYELRGHGNSGMPSAGYTSRDMASDLGAVLDGAGISKAHIVGHSFGGCVALHYAALNPDRVLSLTLADAVVKALQPSMKLSDWPYWRDVLKEKYISIGIEIDDNAIDMDADLIGVLAAPTLAGARKKFRSLDFFLPFGTWNGGKKAAMLWKRLIEKTTARRDFKDPAGLTKEMISGLCCKSLALYGEHSMFLKTCEALSGLIPHCETIIVSGRGHFHPAMCPDIFATTFMDFARRSSAAVANF